MNDDLYKAYILDVYKNMHNKHSLENAVVMEEGYNASCGDKLKIYIQLDNNIVTDMSFTGEGCILSQVSAEVLSDIMKGKTIANIEAFTITDLLDTLGIHPLPTRIRCIELSLKAEKEGLRKQQNNGKEKEVTAKEQ